MFTTMFWSGLTLLVASLSYRITVRLRRRRILMQREMQMVCRRYGPQN